MKLNEGESKVIQRLRKTEESWWLYRWVALVVGFLLFAGSLFVFERIWSTVQPDQILILLCLLVAPVSGIVLSLGVIAVLYAFAFWNGRPVNKLLLRLAGEAES